MYKNIIRIIFLFSILTMVSCSQSENTESEENPESEANEVKSTNTNDEPPEEEIPYPSIFTEMQVPLINSAYIIHAKQLNNNKKITGMQIWEKSGEGFEDVKSYYLKTIPENGWERKTDADKQSTPEQERDDAPVEVFCNQVS